MWNELHYSPDPRRHDVAALSQTLRTVTVCATAIICALLVAKAIGEKHQTNVKIELVKPIMEVK